MINMIFQCVFSCFVFYDGGEAAEYCTVDRENFIEKLRMSQIFTTIFVTYCAFLQFSRLTIRRWKFSSACGKFIVLLLCVNVSARSLGAPFRSTCHVDVILACTGDEMCTGSKREPCGAEVHRGCEHHR